MLQLIHGNSDDTDTDTDTEMKAAIVGIGCRYPGGVHGPSQFWDFLKNGGDGVTEVPKDRWSVDQHYDASGAFPGKSYVKRGAFLSDWDPHDFDPSFFGISAREAETIDPQQRLMLEMAFEAMEDAGMSPEQAAEKATGVFLGCFAIDNFMTQMGPHNRHLINTHTATSSTMTILANRISYVFGLNGPSLTIDTACSSSMVALHYAMRSMQAGDCGMALVGGVNVMMRPEYWIIMAAGHFLSKDGRSKAFDSRADGYGRGEGGGMLLLKPYEAAKRDGDRIYATIVSTGVNQDGRTNGISVPNGDAQQTLLRSSIAQAGITPQDVAYVEAHGTGTAVGDPIECNAIGSVIGKNRAAPCPVGSLKSSIGHQEAGAGVAGVIKATLALRNGMAPPQANLEELNPAIPFDTLGITVPRQGMPLEQQDGAPLHAVINSFGYGGTNAVAVLRAEPEETKKAVQPAVVRSGEAELVLPLSARDLPALRERAASVAGNLRTSAASGGLEDLLWTASHRRPHLSHRLLARSSSAEALADALDAFGKGEVPDGIVVDRAVTGLSDESATKPVFVYSGMGPQRAQMGMPLFETEPVFRAAAKEADAAFRAVSGWSVLEEIARTPDQSKMTDTRIAQPSNALLQIALTELLRERGVMPAAVVGHSVGEIGSGYASGLLSLKDAMTVSYHRSRMQALTAGQGTMLAVALVEDEAQDIIARLSPDVAVAAINAPSSLTLAGPAVSLRRIADELDKQNKFNRFLTVEIAYHSPQMNQIKDQLLEVLGGIGKGNKSVPLVSTVTGLPVFESAYDADYWWRNVREPVRFQKAVETLLGQGHRHFLEVGPHPVLSQAINACLSDSGVSGAAVSTLNRKTDDAESFGVAVDRLYTTGCSFDWDALHPSGRQVDLPSYPFQRTRHWTESAQGTGDRVGSDAPALLGRALDGPETARTFQPTPELFHWLRDHVVDGAVVYPGAAYVCSALALLSDREERTSSLVVENFGFRRGLVIEETALAEIRLTLDPLGSHLRIASREVAEGGVWQTHALARLSAAAPEPKRTLDPGAVIPDAPVILRDEIYSNLSARGLDYGPTFQRLRGVRAEGDTVVAELQVGVQPDFSDPCLLDACFHSLIAASDTGDDALFVPTHIRRMRVFDQTKRTSWCIAKINERTDMKLTGDLTLVDENGIVVAEVFGLECSRLNAKTEEVPAWHGWQYDIAWQEVPELTLDLSATADDWVVVGNAAAAEGLAAELKRHGHTVQTPSIDGLRDAVACRDSVKLIFAIASDPGDPAGLTLSRDMLRVVHGITHLPVQIRLAVVMAPGAHPAHADLAAAIGMMRVIATEHPEFASITIDTRDASPGRAWEYALADITGEFTEREIRYDGATRMVGRVRHKAPDPLEKTETYRRKLGNKPVSLSYDRVGDLDSLVWLDTDVPAPGPGEIQLRNQATALNLKDVLKVLGLLDRRALENTYYTDGLGMETAAEVIAVGPDVTDLKAGDRIVIQSRNGFRSVFNERVEDIFWTRQVPELTPEQNASILVVYVTAHYALTGLGGLCPGERVLIHAGAGGVGQAAIRIAKALGAEIYATAGSEEKRALLREQGCTGVYDSRSLDFAEEIRRDTNGEGVDIVLNSLSGESATLSLELLRPHGRFIEIGKRDFQSDSTIAMALFNRGLTYSALDIDRRMVESPVKYKQMVRDLWTRMEEGWLVPDHPTVIDADNILEGFRYLSQSKNTGKVVVGFDSEAEIETRTRPRTAADMLSEDGTYLITGGLTGLGLLTAENLHKQGAGHLVLCGRRGIDADGAAEAVEALRQKGASVEAAALDVTDEAAVRALVDRICATDRPLKGIVHSAGVLDDGLIASQTEERIHRVMAPKSLGAWNLHKVTEGHDLDFFVIYSSFSAIVGNAGQSGYAAANCFADALAHYRRASGQHGLSINWGPVAEVGMAARNVAVIDYFDNLGIYSLAPDYVVEVFLDLLAGPAAQMVVGDLDWRRWTVGAPAKAAEPFFELIRGDAETSNAGKLIKKLEPLGGEERSELVLGIVNETIAGTLKIEAEQIEPETPLADLGLDSLMTVELQTAIGSEFGVEISTMELMKSTGTLSLSRDLLSKLDIGGGDASPGAGEAPAKTAVSQGRAVKEEVA